MGITKGAFAVVFMVVCESGAGDVDVVVVEPLVRDC